MNNKTNFWGNLIGVVVLVATLGGFAWLWFSFQPSSESDQIVTTPSSTIDSVTKQATTLMANRDNLANIPIQAPTSDQIGRNDPFAGL